MGARIYTHTKATHLPLRRRAVGRARILRSPLPTHIEKRSSNDCKKKKNETFEFEEKLVRQNFCIESFLERDVSRLIAHSVASRRTRKKKKGGGGR